MGNGSFEKKLIPLHSMQLHTQTHPELHSNRHLAALFATYLKTSGTHLDRSIPWPHRYNCRKRYPKIGYDRPNHQYGMRASGGIPYNLRIHQHPDHFMFVRKDIFLIMMLRGAGQPG